MDPFAEKLAYRQHGIVALPAHELGNLSWPHLRERIVHVLANERAVAILFATPKDASSFVDFCSHYFRKVTSAEPFSVYLRPNESGVIGTPEMVHLGLSSSYLARMLSRLKATGRFFDPKAEVDSVVIELGDKNGVGFTFVKSSGYIFARQPVPTSV